MARKHRGGFCMDCGRWRDTLHVDHITPRWKGGQDTPDNLQFLCANCHEDKTREDLIGFPSVGRKVGSRHSDETRAKMSATHKELGLKPMLGKRHSAETRAAYSAARSGAGNPRYGKTVSAETRAKMSAARRRRVIKDETRAKLSASHLGKQHSEETRAKMRATWALRKLREVEATDATIH